jgi:hypothetical protein
MPFLLGVEEELLLADRQSLALAPVTERDLTTAPSSAAHLKGELSDGMIELATELVAGTPDPVAILTTLRERVRATRLRLAQDRAPSHRALRRRHAPRRAAVRGDRRRHTRAAAHDAALRPARARRDARRRERDSRPERHYRWIPLLLALQRTHHSGPATRAWPGPHRDRPQHVAVPLQRPAPIPRLRRLLRDGRPDLPGRADPRLHDDLVRSQAAPQARDTRGALHGCPDDPGQPRPLGLAHALSRRPRSGHRAHIFLAAARPPRRRPRSAPRRPSAHCAAGAAHGSTWTGGNDTLASGRAATQRCWFSTNRVNTNAEGGWM